MEHGNWKTRVLDTASLQTLDTNLLKIDGVDGRFSCNCTRKNTTHIAKHHRFDETLYCLSTCNTSLVHDEVFFDWKLADLVSYPLNTYKHTRNTFLSHSIVNSFVDAVRLQ